MRLVIHRGTEQIGGSCIELATDNSRIIFDIGRELPDISEEKSNKEPALPKVKGLYRDDRKEIDAIFISHGHGDHVGLIEYTHPEIPVYIGEMAYKILDTTAKFTGGRAISNPLKYFKRGEEIVVGDFSITPYLVDHSGYDSYGFIIKAEGKSIVYTGDFRDHGRKKKATDYFKYNIPKGVDGLLIEGTMMGRSEEVIETEEKIEERAYQFMKSKDSPILVLQSSVNIDRLVSMYRASAKSGRIFVMDIFTAHIVSQLSASIPKPRVFKNIRVFYPYLLNKRMFETAEGKSLMKKFGQYCITRDELSNRQDYCMLIRPSMLSDLEHIKNLEGSGFIYSIWSGYKGEKRTSEILDYAMEKNMDIVDFHTSGHASVEYLSRFIEHSKPKRLIPIHTESSHQFAERFKNVHIAKDVETIEI